jgi:ribosomal protein S18 acetylase RimI-like enzyme
VDVTRRPTRDEDLDFVLALESQPENARFVGQWSRDEHRDAMARPDREHWILADARSRERLGYLIAFDLRAQHCGVYVKRIVSDVKSKGVGREAMRGFAHHAFEDLAAPFVWLSVDQDNERGKRCYRALGFAELVAEPDELARLDRSVERSPTTRSLRFVLYPP